jgi:hypothetical protein
MMGATKGTGTAYSSGAPEFAPGSYTSAAGMLLHINGKITKGKLISPLLS